MAKKNAKKDAEGEKGAAVVKDEGEGNEAEEAEDEIAEGKSLARRAVPWWPGHHGGPLLPPPPTPPPPALPPPALSAATPPPCASSRPPSPQGGENRCRWRSATLSR